MIGTVLGAKYRIDALLGRGGMGEVYRATQIDLDRAVAIKIVRGNAAAAPAVFERFEREARTVARLRHPHIVAIHDFGVEPGVGAYLVMELLEGQSLREDLRAKGRFSPHEAIRVFSQICMAVDAAHAAGIVHRDLKPDNIVVERGTAKVLDFGVAKMLDLHADTTLTHTGAFVGTPSYASPEVCEGLPIDARADVYSLGCMLYELLTGRPPFEARSLLKMLNMHVHQAPVPPGEVAPGIPPALEAIVLRAIEKAPEQRYPSAAVMARELEEFERGATADTLATTMDRDEPPPSRPSMPGNLPAQTTRFIGRARELEELAAALITERIVTLTGPGGIGKTRLAVEAVSRVARTAPGGVWMVPLAAITDGNDVVREVAGVLGLGEDRDAMLVDKIVARLRGPDTFLIVDNCEHVVAACASLVHAIAPRCPRLRVLATSREVLGVPGEVVRPVAPLPLDADGGGALVSDAVQLFADRARHARAGFTLTTANAGVLSRICSELDGIPLAIELAAARMSVLSPQQILDRLSDRFRLLKTSARGAPGRQQTLRATIDWSHDLLTGPERAVFRRLAVFAGGCAPEAAEYVCEFSGDEFGDDSILDLLEALADKSLVTVRHSPGGDSRLMMLETIKRYAAARLAESGDEPLAAERHRQWFDRFAAGMRDEASPIPVEERVANLHAEHDNLRRALTESLAAESPAEATLRLAVSMSRFWYVRGYWREGREWFEKGFGLPGDVPDALRAASMHDYAGLLERLGEYDRAKTFYDEGLALQLAIGDRAGAAHSMHNLGVNATDRGDYERARALHTEAVALYRELGHKMGVIMSTNGLGVAEYNSGNADKAIAYYEASLDLLRGVKNDRGVGIVLFNLGNIALERRELDRAEQLLGDSLLIARKLADKWFEANVLHAIAILATWRGDRAAAVRCFSEALELRAWLGDRTAFGQEVLGIGSCALEAGQPREACVLWHAGARLLESAGVRMSALDDGVWTGDGKTAEARLSPGEASAAAAEARALTDEEAIARAIAVAVRLLS